ncbi:hypothetical protein AAFF27_12745 [Xylophilus sp. GW821-FHT01B05]
MNQAILVIDVRHAFFDAGPCPDEAALELARINALTERARQAGAPGATATHTAAHRSP